MEYCFAYDQGSNGKYYCKALDVLCNGQDDKCKFFKTEQKHRSDRINALMRIATLPEHQQKAISEAYYRGERPWIIYAEANSRTSGIEAAGSKSDSARMDADAQIESLLHDLQEAGCVHVCGENTGCGVRGESGGMETEGAGVL